MWAISSDMSRLQYEIHWTDTKNFYVRFKEHFCNYKHGDGKSKFTLQLLDNKYSISSIEDIMEKPPDNKRIWNDDYFGKIPYL